MQRGAGFDCTEEVIESSPRTSPRKAVLHEDHGRWRAHSRDGYSSKRAYRRVPSSRMEKQRLRVGAALRAVNDEAALMHLSGPLDIGVTEPQKEKGANPKV